MPYEFKHGRFNVHYLTASYSLLVKAFGDDGLNSPRDEDKVNAQWAYEDLEVYDYLSAVPPQQVAEWHVQGSGTGIARLLSLLDAADRGDA